MSLTLGTRLGPYQISAPIGAGGMGEVFRARDTKLNRDVAIKVLPAAFADDDEYDLGQGVTIAAYDVMPDGRFIMLSRDAKGEGLRLILNWTEELKEIIARGGIQ